MDTCAEVPAEYYERGLALKNEGNYEEAISEFKRVLEMDAANVPARIQLALVFGFAGMFDESLSLLQETVQIAPTDLDARNNLGLTYAMLGMLEEAKFEFLFVLECDPNNEIAQKNMLYF